MTYEQFRNVLYGLSETIINLGGILTGAAIIYYGFRMAFARENESAFLSARKGLTWAILGGLVIFGVWTIINTIHGAVDSLG